MHTSPAPIVVISHCISNGFIAEVHWVTVAGKKTGMKLWEGALPVVHHSGSLASKDRTQKKALMSGKTGKKFWKKLGSHWLYSLHEKLLHLLNAWREDSGA